jgi:hypothetical protein
LAVAAAAVTLFMLALIALPLALITLPKVFLFFRA